MAKLLERERNSNTSLSIYSGKIIFQGGSFIGSVLLTLAACYATHRQELRLNFDYIIRPFFTYICAVSVLQPRWIIISFLKELIGEIILACEHSYSDNPFDLCIHSMLLVA